PSNVVKNQPFSKFRLFQFGPNSNSHHYLPCSGFEIYGTVVSGVDAPSEEDGPKGNKRIFKYTQDMDFNGLFYFLGTNGGERQWTNPVDLRLVNVDASSLMSDSAPLSALCGRASVRCVTKPHQKSWMSIDLKDIKMRLSHYTLRHYNSWDTEALRFWVLEGSDDGVAWIPLRQHADDKALRKSGMTHTWPIETSQYFSRFRLFMTGRNSNNHW
ncbi:E3 ubiquitin-protein ligase HECTD1, partial [Reticulomyxa filosa]